jgi:hypothetical protein
MMIPFLLSFKYGVRSYLIYFERENALRNDAVGCGVQCGEVCCFDGHFIAVSS